MLSLSMFSFNVVSFNVVSFNVVSFNQLLHFTVAVFAYCAILLVCHLEHLVKGVQCYELFGGIARKNHTF